MSATQTSPVPGRNVNRKGLRKPQMTMRRAFGSALDAFGLVGIAAPVPGSTRTDWCRSKIDGVICLRCGYPAPGALHLRHPARVEPRHGQPAGRRPDSRAGRSPRTGNLPLSPPLADRAPSGPKRRLPSEWLGNC